MDEPDPRLKEWVYQVIVACFSQHPTDFNAAGLLATQELVKALGPTAILFARGEQVVVRYLADGKYEIEMAFNL